MDDTEYARQLDPAVSVRRSEAGLTLAEVIVSLGLFALIAVGALGILGATSGGGAIAATATAVGAVRLSKDHTAAAVYLQSVQEFLAEQTAAGLSPGVYSFPPFPAQWSGAPRPPSTSDQLGRPQVVVVVERWYWDAAPPGRYCLVGTAGCGAGPASESLTRAISTLTWEFRGVPRTLTVARFIP